LRVVSPAGEKVESPSFIPCFRGHKSASSSHFVPLIIIFIIIITAVRLVTKKTILAFFVSLSVCVSPSSCLLSHTRTHTQTRMESSLLISNWRLAKTYSELSHHTNKYTHTHTHTHAFVHVGVCVPWRCHKSSLQAIVFIRVFALGILQLSRWGVGGRCIHLFLFTVKLSPFTNSFLLCRGLRLSTKCNSFLDNK